MTTFLMQAEKQRNDQSSRESKAKAGACLTVHGLLVHLVDTFVLVDSIKKFLVRLLNHPDLIIIIDEVSELFEVCWERWIGR